MKTIKGLLNNKLVSYPLTTLLLIVFFYYEYRHTTHLLFIFNLINATTFMVTVYYISNLYKKYSISTKLFLIPLLLFSIIQATCYPDIYSKKDLDLVGLLKYSSTKFIFISFLYLYGLFVKKYPIREKGEFSKRDFIKQTSRILIYFLASGIILIAFLEVTLMILIHFTPALKSK